MGGQGVPMGGPHIAMGGGGHMGGPYNQGPPVGGPHISMGGHMGGPPGLGGHRAFPTHNSGGVLTTIRTQGRLLLHTSCHTIHYPLHTSRGKFVKSNNSLKVANVF